VTGTISAQQLQLIVARKDELRRQAQAARRGLADRPERSAAICRRVLALPEYAAARTVMLYLSMPHEVQTGDLLTAVWNQGKQLVVPYLDEQQIALFRLDSLDELSAGVWNILEPCHELRLAPERRLEPAAVDLVVVPGVVFDRRGGRVGHGKGYYDKFLKRIRPATLRTALGFECQLADEVPMLPHDVFMHQVVTEQAVYPGPGG
jgi:5-formyltetrahydrofolate cyclo-ligase